MILGVFLLQLIIKPYHYAVFTVNIIAPSEEGAYAAEVWMFTQFEVSFTFLFFIENILLPVYNTAVCHSVTRLSYGCTLLIAGGDLSVM
jgi:hypothetical protein